MKVVYVLSVNRAPKWGEGLDLEGVYLKREDAYSDGLEMFINDPVVKEMYEEYIDDDYHEKIPTLEEYITEGDPYFMEIVEMPVHQRSAKEVRENG